MVAIGQTITIVNKSGKVVSSSKSLVSVFNEAKSAYNERKAEIKATRRDYQERKEEERKARKHFEELKLEDDSVSGRSSRRGSDDGRSSRHSSRSEHRRERPPVERGVSDSFYTNDVPSSSSRHERPAYRSSPLRAESNRSDLPSEPRAGELIRRHTDHVDQYTRRNSLPAMQRRVSEDDIDMDLAYGELPPPLPERKYDTEIELRSKMSGLQRLLDECNCLQYSVTAIIDKLQKEPDTLAAVALTLAEISNLATKMAPGALMTMKGSFPAIIALLASPEFAIAAGVGVGVTIIAFGGYKIVKKIKARKDAMLLDAGPEQATTILPDEQLTRGPDNEESDMDSLRELNHIERWRRGIADAEAESVGGSSASVEGEFLTPQATKTLIEEGKITEDDLKSRTSRTSRHGSDGGKSGRSRREKGKSSAGKSSKSEAKAKSKSKGKSRKEPSGLRMLFKKS